MRLIDAEKLEEYKADCCVSLTQWQEGWNDAIDMIMSETPTVDAVPVIRCKDCVEYVYNQCWGLLDGNFVYDDGYCSRGEKKNEID